jgi:hypothetical protein
LDLAKVTDSVTQPGAKMYLGENSSAGYAGQQTGRGMKIGLGAFMSGWQAGNYALTTVEARV